MALHERIMFKSRNRNRDQFYSRTRNDLEEEGIFNDTIKVCVFMISSTGADTSSWQHSDRSLGDIEQGVENLWYTFGRAAMSADNPLDRQKLVALLSQIRNLGIIYRQHDKQEEIARMHDGLLWVDLPGFQQMMEQTLQAAFDEQFSASTDTTTLYWTNLNQVLVRVSVAGLCDLRKCCLWALRIVLEDPVQVKKEMLEVLMVWLQAYGFWIERLVMFQLVKRSASKATVLFTNRQDETALSTGDLLNEENKILPPINQDRCLYWRGRLEEVGRDSEELKEAAEKVLQLLPAIVEEKEYVVVV